MTVTLFESLAAKGGRMVSLRRYLTLAVRSIGRPFLDYMFELAAPNGSGLPKSWDDGDLRPGHFPIHLMVVSEKLVGLDQSSSSAGSSFQSSLGKMRVLDSVALAYRLFYGHGDDKELAMHCRALAVEQ